MKTFIHHDELVELESITTENNRLYSVPASLGKEYYPSISSICSLESEDAIIKWRKRVGQDEANKICKVASTRGTKLHKHCEKYLLGETLEFNSPFEEDLFRSVEPVLERIDNIHALETTVYSEFLQVGGRTDCIADFTPLSLALKYNDCAGIINGKLSVIDFKTSGQSKKHDWIHGYFMQAAAYAVAFEERTGISVPTLVIIAAINQDAPQVFIESRDKWINPFIELRKKYFDRYHI